MKLNPTHQQVGAPRAQQRAAIERTGGGCVQHCRSALGVTARHVPERIGERQSESGGSERRRALGVRVTDQSGVGTHQIAGEHQSLSGRWSRHFGCQKRSREREERRAVVACRQTHTITAQ
jgi:hypothetical protein